MQEVIKKRIRVFTSLGDHMRQAVNALRQTDQETQGLPDHTRHLYQTALRCARQNPWFTHGEIARAFMAISEMLQASVLHKWASQYPSLGSGNGNPLRIAVIMAGNIPLAGFHDMLSVLMSGHHFTGKLSSQDDQLPVAVADVLTALDPSLEGRIEWSAQSVKKADAIIATGSDNSARYFEYYFGDIPHIIRKNRNSAALLSGNESTQDLERLGMDIFSYFGMGCRNVSLLLVPESFNLNRLGIAWKPFRKVLQNEKYMHNIQYHKAFLSVNATPFIDMECILLQKSPELASPVSVLHYWYYKNFPEAVQLIRKCQERLQCVACEQDINLDGVDMVALGKTQQPTLWDYADRVDTIQFLLNI